jgi:hypothetical protein
MKALRLDWRVCKYPPDVNSPRQFIDYISSRNSIFIELVMYDTKNCAHPYYIKDETRTSFVNIATTTEIAEEEITVLDREEYDIRLAECIENVCRNCVSYEEDMTANNMKGHRNNINLDGECPFKQDI